MLKSFWTVGALAAVAVILPLFLTCDCDLSLYFLPYSPKGSFQDKVIWITGASSGIGSALAIDLVKAGAKVIISARRKDKLEEVADVCSKFGERPMVLQLDVTDGGAQEMAYAQVMKKYGKIDSLVLNAGQSQRNVAVETPLQVTRDIMELNFFSYVALTKLVLPSMLERNSGQIVATSSLSGIIGTPIGTSYSASKFALHGYFNGLRGEVHNNGINVLIVCPGPVESEIADKAHRNPKYQKQDEGKKMPTERCSSLMAKGMFYKFEEIWITHQPFLLMTYLTQYMPMVSRIMSSRFVGPARVKIIQEGGDIYDTKSMFGIK